MTGKRRKTKKFAAGSSSSQGGGESDASSMLSEYDINLPTDFVKMEDGGGFDGFMADGM